MRFVFRDERTGTGEGTVNFAHLDGFLIVADGLMSRRKR